MNLTNNNVIHKNSEIEYIQFRRLLEFSEIKHAYVIGLDNSFKIYTDDGHKKENEAAKKSYKKICNELDIEYKNLVNTMQNHTDNIKIVKNKVNKDKPDFNIYEETDGLITNCKNIALSTINADCILLIFYDPTKKVIANVHSGWRGTIKRISIKTVEKMKKEFGSKPEDIICCMSPSICKKHFEVDEDVKDLFYNKFKDDVNIEKYILKSQEKEGKYYIDTVGINKNILLNIGLKEENIIDSKICSVCDEDKIHSYRAHGEKSGRNITIMELI